MSLPIDSRRVCLIPDEIFYKLWTYAKKYQIEEYKKIFTSPKSKERINFEYECNLPPDKADEVMNIVYNMSNRSFKAIVDEIGISILDVSLMYVTSRSTVKNWYYNISKCPEFVKLTILKDFGLLDLGNYVHIESDYNILHPDEDVNKIKKVIRKQTKKRLKKLKDKELSNNKSSVSVTDNRLENNDKVKTRKYSAEKLYAMSDDEFEKFMEEELSKKLSK